MWLCATVAATLASVAAAAVLAPHPSAMPGLGLGSLLFIGSSVHVVSTAWLCSASDLRAEMWVRRRRFLCLPAGLVAIAVVTAALLPPTVLIWLLLPFFGWQFWHFQRQNLGLAALAGLSHGIEPPVPAERRALVVTGCAGVLGVLAHPRLLQLQVDPRLGALFPVALAGFAVGVVAGAVGVAGRPAGRRPAGFCVVFGMSLLFWLPVFVFRSPYAAVGGLTIAHGLQYLMLAGLVATGDRRGHSRVAAAVVMLSVALLVGAALSAASHLHDAGVSVRWLYGAYLGIVMSHFVVDAGVWRLREPFFHQFLAERVPFLVLPSSSRGHPVATPATDGSVADIR